MISNRRNTRAFTAWQKHFLFAVASAVAIMGALAFWESVLQKRELDAAEELTQVVDLAGRQRMLSQQAAKCAAQWPVGAGDAPRGLRVELESCLDQIERSHAALGRSVQTGYVAGEPSVVAQFAESVPVVNRLVAAGRQLLADDRGPRHHPAAQATVLTAAAENTPIFDRLSELLGEFGAGQHARQHGIQAMLGMSLAAVMLVVITPTLLSLRRTEKMFHGLIQSAPDPMVVIDGRGVIVLINEQTEKLFGWSRDELIGKAVEVLLPERYRSGHVAKRHEYFVSPKTRPMSQSLEAFGFHKDGHEIPIELSLSPLQTTGGELVASAIRDITERVRSREALRVSKEEFERAALLDKLTGLPNRRLFMDRLQQAIRRASRHAGQGYAVMFLDFDRFKRINDSLGHDVGDMLLVEISARLRTQLRTVDSIAWEVAGHTAGRFGGDEFVVLLDEIRSVEDANAIANRLLSDLARPFVFGKHELFSTASIGIVIGDAAYRRPEEVIRDADTAMYEAKRTGRGRFVVFNETMRERVVRRSMLESDLRKAIDGDELSLAYQPIVCLATGEVHSVEALLRWQHPAEGPIGPGEFIPIAEESNLIIDLSEWVLREGCRQFADWTKGLGDAAPPVLSLNLSRKLLAWPALPAFIQSLVDEFRLDPARLQFEITEDAFVGDISVAIAAVRAIKALGVKIAIDDFGTGCSSFASLHQFPVDVLKIDRSMIMGIENSRDSASLVHALAVLVNNLGITLVSEGIEKSSQVLALQELGCYYGQGYLLARPLSAPDLEHYLVHLAPPSLNVVGAAAFANRWEDRLECFQFLGHDSQQ